MDVDVDFRDRTKVHCRGYQGKLVRELAKREGLRVVELMDQLLIHGYKALGYDVEELKRTIEEGIKSRWARDKY